MSLLGEDDTSSLGQTELNWRLFDAIYYKDVDSIYRYVFAGAEVTYANEVGNQCIHAAAHTGVPKIVQIIINAGGDVHAKGREDNTPLHFAVAVNSIPVVKLLLEKGADPRAVNRKGKSPRDICSVDNTREEILELLESWVLKRCAFLFTPKVDQNIKGKFRPSNASVAVGGKRLEFANANFATTSRPHGNKVQNERKVSAAKAQPLIAAVQPLIADAKKLGLGKQKPDFRSPGISKSLFQVRFKSGMNDKSSIFSPSVDLVGKPGEGEREGIGNISTVSFSKLRNDRGHYSDSAVNTPVPKNSDSAVNKPVSKNPPNSKAVNEIAVEEDKRSILDDGTDQAGKGFYVEIDGKQVFVPEDYSDEDYMDSASEIGSENEKDEGIEKPINVTASNSNSVNTGSAHDFENEDSTSEPVWNHEVMIGLKCLDGSLGIQLQEDGKYTKVSDMNPDGNAAASGVKIGDVLVQINDVSMEGMLLASVMTVLSEEKEKGILTLKLKRD